MTPIKAVNYWVTYSLLLLVVVALAGFMMRLLPLVPIPILNYQNLLHAHSHLAFLGWVYNALYAGLVWAFIPPEKQLFSKYNTLFWITQVITIGMFTAFITDGYHTPAVVTLSAHTLVSYVFMIYFLRDSKNTTAGLAGLMMKAALFCLFLSSLGPLAIPVITANAMNADYIKLAINFYLHFQYNGWFVFGILALIIKLLPESSPGNKLMVWGCAFLLIGVFPSYFLSVQWVGLPIWIRWIAGLAGTVQFIGAFIFGWRLLGSLSQWRNFFTPVLDNVLLFGVMVFVIKYLLLMLSIFPEMYEMVFQSRNIMIAYLHWHFLGFVTLTLLTLFGSKGYLPLNTSLFRTGMAIFIAGFLLQETYLFTYQKLVWLGVSLPEVHFETLLLASILLLAGTAVILSEGIRSFHKSDKYLNVTKN